MLPFMTGTSGILMEGLKNAMITILTTTTDVWETVRMPNARTIIYGTLMEELKSVMTTTLITLMAALITASRLNVETDTHIVESSSATTKTLMMLTIVSMTVLYPSAVMEWSRFLETT